MLTTSFAGAGGGQYRAGATLASTALTGDTSERPVYLVEALKAECPVSSITVLCVDDDNFQREALASLFAIANKKRALYKPTFVASADEALAALKAPQSLQPDLVLLDILLSGGMNGDELIPMMRPLLPEHCKIVMASVESQVQRVQRLLEGGADGFLVKPIAPDTIKVIWQYVHPPTPVTPRAGAGGSPHGSPKRGATTPSGALAAPVQSSGRASGGAGSGHVYSRLRGANPAGRLRPIRLQQDDEEHDIGMCKQQ